MIVALLDQQFPYHISNKIFKYYRQDILNKIHEIILHKLIFIYYKENKKDKNYKLTWLVSENQNYYSSLDDEETI